MPELLAAARAGDRAAFDRLVAPHRRELFAHGYRMLGSAADAEDALQETLLGAWRGLGGFAERGSLRGWLYQICTNACLRLVAQRPRRLLAQEHAPPRQDTAELGAMVPEPIWVEPCPDDALAPDPGTRLLLRESVELAFVAALQHLPGAQRAVLVLRDVLDFSAAEVAEMLGTTVAAANSALQRARQSIADRVPARSQHDELAALGDGVRPLLDAFVSAWERADLPALLALLTEDTEFSMPPLPAWFQGRAAVGRFFAERVFATPWRLVPLRANGQLGFACYMRLPGADRFTLGAINVLTLREGRIARIAAFLAPELHRAFALPAELPEK